MSQRVIDSTVTLTEVTDGTKVKPAPQSPTATPGAEDSSVHAAGERSTTSPTRGGQLRIWVLALTGDLDLYSSQHVRQRSAELLTAALAPAAAGAGQHTGQATVVLDLFGVDFVDSAGLSTLVTIVKLARAHHTALLAAGASHSLQRTLSMLGMDRLMPSYPNVEAALAATRAPSS